ncbi:hypothetical protein KSP39_PZI005596 [Platanthera zijinensis]|uniref:Uncharacterized protein n=1 Tax=Platanthera zijinensis TaxID=2320716 RepID=A0AAP0BUK0_9ASPA
MSTSCSGRVVCTSTDHWRLIGVADRVFQFLEGASNFKNQMVDCRALMALSSTGNYRLQRKTRP